MVELAGVALLLIGAVFGAIESKKTWGLVASFGAFFGCLVIGTILILFLPFIGWLAAPAPAVGLVAHARTTRFRRIASEPDTLDGP